MHKVILIASAGLALAAFSAPVSAATCSNGTWRNLQAATLAKASDVMDNLNYVRNCPTFVATTNQPWLELNAGSTTGIDYTGYAHNDLLLGSYLSGGYPQTYMSFGYEADASRKFHIGTASDASFNSATSFLPALTITAGRSIGIKTTAPNYTLEVNGPVAASSFTSLSDARLKKDITPISNALALVSQLRGVRFSWRSAQERTVGKTLVLASDKRQIGFIAQEVKPLVPEAISVAEGKEGIMSLQEAKVVPLLVEAIKELKAINDKQAGALERLQKQLGELQTQRTLTAIKPTLLQRLGLILGWGEVRAS